MTPLQEARSDPEMREVAAMFLDLAPKRVQRIVAALDAGDATACERAAHSLCGSARTFGATMLGAIASEIERECGSGDLELVAALLPRLGAALAELEAEFGDIGDEEAAVAPDAAVEAAARPGAYRVLIADDDPDVCAFIEQLLATGPFDVIGVTHDAKLAIETAVREQPEIVLLDWVMPGGGGSRAALEIADSVDGVCIVGISSYEGDEARMDMARVGARAFVPKEALADSLVSSIAQALSF